MKRLFIAIKPEFDSNIIEEFNNIKNYLKEEKIKWVNFNDIHITLKFLGDTPENLIIPLQNSLLSTTKSFESFNLNFKGVGIFKNIKFPRVLWVGVEHSEYLENLFYKIDNICNEFGFKKESRKFIPHLTLGRIKNIKNQKKLVKIITEKANFEFQQIEVNKYYLIESQLTPKGPIYTIIKEFPLI